MFNKFKCRFNYKLLVPLLFFASTFSANAQEINFTQSWLLLQEKNSSIAAKRANVERYQQLEEADDALNYPSVTLGANYTRLNDEVTFTGGDLGITNATAAALFSSLSLTVAEKETVTSSVKVLWPIYTGGKITAAQSYSAGRADEAVAQLNAETQARYNDLAQYYFSAVLAKDVLNTRKSVEKTLAQHRDFAIKLEEQGQIAHVERLQADASLATAVVDRKKAQRDLDITLSALTSILNQEEKITPVSSLFINKTLPPLAEFTKHTLKTYPGLSVLNAKEKQASSAIKAEQSKYYPNVFLFGDYVVYEEDSTASDLTPDWYVGVGVSVPLIDNSGRSEKLQAAHSAVSQIQYLRQQAYQDLKVLVEKTYYSAEQAIEEVEGLESSLALAEENSRLRQKSFTQGLSTSLDVIDAQLYLANIKTQQQIARYNYVIALNKLLSLSDEIPKFAQYEAALLQTNRIK
ncbi:MAG: TolC family protein [Marinomonas colpomeniae]